MVMNTFLRLTLAVALGAAVSPALAQNRGGRGGGSAPARSAPASRPAQASRPRAPQPMRMSPGAITRPSGGARPPAQHFDLRSAPQRAVQPQSRPEGQAQGRPEGQAQGRPEVRPQGQAQAHPFSGRVDARGWGAPDHRSVVASKNFAQHAFAHEADERQVNHIYWHTEGGGKYAHWYDGKVHWYGFYNGPRFYWTRYEDNRWWWYDQTATRWLYWHDGYWWWNDPANAAQMYVVVNDSYYPYAEVAADPSLAPGAAPDDSSSAMSVVDAAGKGVHGNFAKRSPDGTREIQVYGDRREAFLYDLTGGGDPRFIAYLATGVKHVTFSEASGSDMQIMLLMLDGSYDVFDADGNSILPKTGNGAPAQPGTPGADAIPADSSSQDAAPPSAPPDTSGASSASPSSAPRSGPRASAGQ
jgi:hypothetical protein